jgi:hypothetical protein
VVGDNVIVSKKYDASKVYVVGHVGGIKSCSYDVYLRLYLNGILAEYGGEQIDMFVNGVFCSSEKIHVKDTLTNPLRYGVSDTFFSLLGVSDDAVVTFKLLNLRTTGALLNAAYASVIATFGQSWPDDLFWGFEPYDIVTIPVGDPEYSHSGAVPVPPFPPRQIVSWAAWYTDNRVSNNMSKNIQTVSYLLLTTTVGAIKSTAVNLVLSESETIRVFDIRGTLPDFCVLKNIRNDSTVYYSKPGSGMVSGAFEQYATVTYNTGETVNCYDWYGPTQDGTYVFAGKPRPEIDDSGILTWEHSASYLYHRKDAGCAVVETVTTSSEKQVIPRIV